MKVINIRFGVRHKTLLTIIVRQAITFVLESKKESRDDGR